MTEIISDFETINYEQYSKDGYLIIENFLSKEECQALLNRTHQLIETYNIEESKSLFQCNNNDHLEKEYFLESHDKIHFFFEPDAFDEKGNLAHDIHLSVNKIGHGLHEVDPTFQALCHSNRLKNLCEQLSIPNAQVLQSMIICKQAFVGGEVTCHQDKTFLYTKNNSLAGLWFALEDATIENSCLWAIPGGHTTQLKQRMIRKDNTISFEEYDETPWDLNKMVPLEVPQGSLILLHGLLPHMSRANYSPKSRHAYAMHLMANDDKLVEGNWIKRSDAFVTV